MSDRLVPRHSEARATWDRVMETHSGTELKWGPTNVDRFLGDPKRIAFFMSRYKFAAKVLSDSKYILDVGCGDGMGAATFLYDTNAIQIIGVDWEQKSIDYAVQELLPALGKVMPSNGCRLMFSQVDFFETAYRNFDGLCCLDMIEHIEPGESDKFIGMLADVLNPGGIAVIGTPNEYAHQYASRHSRIGHINLFSPGRLRDDLAKKFKRVILFSMNDEIVHTGYDKMAHYLLALAIK